MHPHAARCVMPVPETGAVEERGNDLERREDGQLDGPCMQRRLVVQADAVKGGR